MKEGKYLIRGPRKNDLVDATILAISDRDILVELDGKRDGVVPRRDLENLDADYLAQLKVGDHIPVQVTQIPFNRSSLLVSLKQGLERQDWLRAEELMKSEEIIAVQVVQINRGGVIAQLGNLQGFIPNSHLVSIPRSLKRKAQQEHKAALINKTLSVLVIEVNARRRRLILSERKAQHRVAGRIA